MHNLAHRLFLPNDKLFAVGAVYIYVRACALLTQSGLHRVNNVCKALSVERVGIKAAVKARVDPQHCVVQDLWHTDEKGPGYIFDSHTDVVDQQVRRDMEMGPPESRC